ncbi:archease [Candidatus Aerophobetes bacterium]|nr:archease [Candidatus Aerophobetes bacterium]
MMPGYEFINHTADLGIKVRGKNLSELFANAAYALFDIILDISRVKPAQSRKIKIPGGEIEDIFFEWMRELLSKFNIDALALKEFTINKLDKTGLEAIVKGEQVDASRHNLKTEIKAVTYHGLKIQKNNKLWEVQVIFDI